MRADETNLLKFLNGPKQFIIPIYQRTYSWTQLECRQLWNDVVRAGKDDSISGHFVGSIVYVEKGLYQISAVPKFLVIDGQQRLTTISLLLSALSKAVKDSGDSLDMSSEKLKSYYLLNDKEDGDLKYKLVLTKSDKDTLFKVVDHKDLTDDDSLRLKDNYEYFVEQISKCDLEVVYQGVAKLILIDVSLDRERDNPQLIFESLNSTGLELTQADLVRNYILMGLEKNEQETLYSDYWFPMEKNFGHAEYSDLFDRFMRDYLTIKTGKIPNIKDVYSAFKAYAQKFDSMKDLVEEIFKYSKYFVSFALEREEDSEIKEVIRDINTLKVDVSYPFLLQAYEDYSQEILSKEKLLKMLRYIESYVFRRAICGIPTNSLNKTFANLYKEIKQENYVESFIAKMLLKDSYRRFPRNKEFKEQLLIKDVYNLRIRNYLLNKLENYDRKERVIVEEYTIEHIMPQNENLSKEWRQELGDNWEDIHDKYLHTIGNLTLTGYNSELSDRPFKEKRNMKGGFADSPIRLNKMIALLECWSENEIVKRGTALSTLALALWDCPELEKDVIDKYRTIEQRGDKTYSLDDHLHLAEGSPMFSLYQELRKRILNIDSSVTEEILKLYIAYKASTNFVDIVPQKSRLRLSLNMRFDEINDLQNICKDVTDKGRWGNGDVEVGISSVEEIDYVMSLIKQAFEKVSEE